MIISFLERARKRYLWNELVAQSALAAALLLGGLILLLLAGTQLLDWRLVLALVAIGLGAGIYRTMRSLPSSYRLAVLVDSRAGLHDALSTAVHFSDHVQGPLGLPAIRAFQKAQAERLIPTVDLRLALPFRIPRALYVMGLFGVVATSLFALRFGIRRSLDFQAPLTQVVMEGFGWHEPEDKQAANRKKNSGGKEIDSLDEQGMQLSRSEQKRAGELDAAPPSALETVGDPDLNNENAQSAARGKEASVKGGDGTDKDGSDKSAGEQGENAQSAANKSGADNPAGSREGPQQGEQSQSQQGGQPNSSSLLSKMKDAMQNLMSKAMPQQNGQAGQKPSAAQGQQKSQSQQAKAGEKGSPSESKDGSQQESADGQQGQQAGDPENSDNGQGKGNGKSSEQQAAAQPGSGIGKQDGAKDLKAAEQKAAMGKLSEVIGKRSASLSGEMMVESQSGPQQLRTQYSRRSATHGETSGEVNRDEIPVELQSYVQNYFEEVRKAERQAGATRKAPAKQLESGQPK